MMMMMNRRPTWWCAVLAVACAAATSCSGASVPSTVTDLLWTGLEGVIQQRSGLSQHAESKQVPEKRCECQSPELKSCVCCLRMSLPFLDLTTSPGCVKFKYVPDIDSIAVNVTGFLSFLFRNRIYCLTAAAAICASA